MPTQTCGVNASFNVSSQPIVLVCGVQRDKGLTLPQDMSSEAQHTLGYTTSYTNTNAHKKH